VLVMHNWHNILRKFRILIAPAAALLLAMTVFSLFLLVKGINPVTTLLAIFYGAFGTGFGFMETLIRATPLLLCAIAVAIPARAGLFNIGGEGQLHFGAIAATVVALKMQWLPVWMVIPVMFLAAMLAGAFWGLWPGLLRARLGVNEILVTLMLNYVAIFLVEYLVHGPWKDPSALGWPYTASFPENAVLPTIGNSNVHLGILIGFVAAIGIFFILRSTIWGFTIRVIEANPVTARYAGMDIPVYFVTLMALGGAFAALAGLGEVSVIQGRLRPGISPGYGYVGVLISWLCRNNLLMIIVVSIFIGGLYSGSDALQITAGLPSATTSIFMGLVFIAFLLSGYIKSRTSTNNNQTEII